MSFPAASEQAGHGQELLGVCMGPTPAPAFIPACTFLPHKLNTTFLQIRLVTAATCSAWQGGSKSKISIGHGLFIIYTEVPWDCPNED